MLGRLRSLYVHAWHVPDYGEYRSLSKSLCIGLYMVLVKLSKQLHNSMVNALYIYLSHNYVRDPSTSSQFTLCV